MKNKTKAVLVDIFGFTLIIVAIPIGWLPGPGGIPLIILGLSLLATNHEWAERIMNRLKAEVSNASKRVTEADPATKWGIDILGIIFITGAVILLTQFTRSITTTAAVSLCIGAAVLLITNQNRHIKLWNSVRGKHKNK
jgi:hypothetical protein